ncbi:arrestin domain-containing protein 17-like [Anticarsia gemmatalis]|uniref:arrestin domain-containing protein 17-like n=1 Tax=Anticarsia gemmatalis TaxID=129554 RepID=UPI003F7700C1
MGFDYGTIILNNRNGVYFAGQNIIGKIVFTKTKPKTISEFYVKFKGFCAVRWTDVAADNTSVVRSSNEEYFNRKYTILEGEHTLEPATHEYPFTIPIPIDTPSSYESKYGHIRYHIKVVVKAKGAFSADREKSMMITVLTAVDLNKIPYCQHPLKFNLVDSYSCCCVRQGSSQVKVTIPSGGFCPGQLMPVQVSVMNPSKVEIYGVRLAILKHTTYIAKSNSGKKKLHDTVAATRRGPIYSRTTRNWNFEMPVPPIKVYNLELCNFIHIRYELKVTVDVSDFHHNSWDTKPIIFGSIPLLRAIQPVEVSKNKKKGNRSNGHDSTGDFGDTPFGEYDNPGINDNDDDDYSPSGDTSNNYCSNDTGDTCGGTSSADACGGGGGVD